MVKYCSNSLFLGRFMRLKTQIILNTEMLINTITVIYERNDESLIVNALELFMSSPSCQKELHNLSEMNGVKIDFTREDLMFQGAWFPEQKEIRVKKGLSLEKTLQTFIFELCNAINPAFKDNQHLCYHFSSADEYATYIEEAEHNSFIKACFLYGEICSKSTQLKPPGPVEIQQLKRLADDASYLDYVKETGHYDHYIAQYNRLMKRQNSFFHSLIEQEDIKTKVSMMVDSVPFEPSISLHNY